MGNVYVFNKIARCSTWALVVIGTASASGAGTVKNVSGKVWIDNVDRPSGSKARIIVSFCFDCCNACYR